MNARRRPRPPSVRRRRAVMAALAAAGSLCSLAVALASPATASLGPSDPPAPTTTVAPAAPAQAVGQPDSRGTDFWLTFPRNYYDPPELTLFITAGVATSGVVQVPGLSFSQPYDVVPGAVTSVVLPPEAQVGSNDVVEDLGIHVTAAQEVTVYGLNRIQYTTDAYLALPTDILGTDHLVMSYPGGTSELALVAATDNTTVTITPTVATFTREAGVPFDVVLDQGQAFQLDAGDSDLTGTQITSTGPVAVYGANGCANIPNGYAACDHIVEQLPPTSAWGKQFLTEPLATRTAGDTFRILASAGATTVAIDGVPVATLGRGEVYEQILTGASVIAADKTVRVAQFSNSSSFDGVTSDPFMMLVPPFEQFDASYTVTTPASGFAQNFLNVVAPTSSVGSVLVDAVPIPPASFAPIGSSGFSGAQVPVALGSHTVVGPSPFGLFSYGFDEYDSYGYPGGSSLAPVATVAALVLSPETERVTAGTSACVTATVTDTNGQRVSGVRVDFAVTGANPQTGFGFTEGGDATYCYVGANVGRDDLTAITGTFSDTATKDWEAGSSSSSSSTSSSSSSSTSSSTSSPSSTSSTSSSSTIPSSTTTSPSLSTSTSTPGSTSSSSSTSAPSTTVVSPPSTSPATTTQPVRTTTTVTPSTRPTTTRPATTSTVATTTSSGPAPTGDPDPPRAPLPPDLSPDAVPLPVPEGYADVVGEVASAGGAGATPADGSAAVTTVPASSTPEGEGTPDEALRTELDVPSAVNGQLLVVSGTLDRPCATVAVEVAGRELASARTEGNRFSMEVDTQALGVGQHEATLVCGDDGAALAKTTLSIVQPVSRASGAGSSIGIVAFLMLGLLALVSLPGPANQDDR